MTWNIRTGGRDADGGDRLALVRRVVTTQRPDLLALQELRGFDRPGVLARFAAGVGMRPYLARSRWGQPVAVLVRPPLRILAAAGVRRPFHHGAQRVTVATSAGPLALTGTHLCPFSGTRRLIEAGWLAAAVRRASGSVVGAGGGADDGPLVLVAGDLNTLEPGVDHRDRIARLPAAYRRRHLRRDGRVDTRAVGRLLAAGLVDLQLTAGRPGDDGATAPTRYGGGVEFSGMRLDYLLATTGLAAVARDCRVVRDDDTDRASDHYPVLVDLAIGAT
ncbi:endonuclease/exonuclease/phosphatase family protein [Micromonospora sp. WMMA1923]|uniref:endonuclease/exonuclease/phosphatase family protein n=1 Tax=Micromonospora sp. WMMA1923 TaxID=3404125 RepID=UPI003B9518E7